MNITKNMYVEDTAASRELEMYVYNDRNIYLHQIKPLISNLQRKFARGDYNATKAVVAFYRITTNASKEFGHKFSVTERWTAAYYILQEFIEDIVIG